MVEDFFMAEQISLFFFVGFEKTARVRLQMFDDMLPLANSACLLA